MNLERTNQSKLIKKENRKELEQSTVSSTQLVEGKTALLLTSMIRITSWFYRGGYKDHKEPNS